MTQLFTRQGQAFTGNVEFDESGKAVRYVLVACNRCHVINGERLWIMGIENGRPFSRTGFSCWTCGNTGVRGQRKERLYSEAELARVNKAAATREANRAAKLQKEEEERQAAVFQKRREFSTVNAEFLAKLNKLADRDSGDFWPKFRTDFNARMSNPTDRQTELVNKAIAKIEKDAASSFVGRVGDKVELTVTIERIVVLNSKLYGISYIFIGRDQDGSVITYKGAADIGLVGDTCTIRATVKAHEMYNGVAQTVIQRPKVI